MTIKSLLPHQYPYLLQQISDKPQELFISGTIPDPHGHFLCIVGARNYTSYGKDISEKLIAGLRGHSIYIVSGLARGIDTIAHKAALEAGLKTIAIPGSGLDESILYPAVNRHVAHQIVDNGGALISEFQPYEKANVWTFPQRNRIMAGMSKAILIIEAEQKSGTLITAGLAATYNRDILTVPGSVFSKNSEGPHYLLRHGAIAITCAQDILEALGIQPQDQVIPNYEDCSDDEKLILHALEQPLTRDQLINQTSFSISQLNILISLLELKNYIIETAGYLRIKLP